MKEAALPIYQPEKNPEDFLYHYTSTAGLIGILESKTIRLTESSFLNDSQEVLYGAKIATTLLRKASTDLIEKNGHDNHVISYTFDVLSSLSKLLESTTEQIGTYQSFPYVASFSETRDDLSQWRGYADNGYCIAFHKDRLSSHLKPDPSGPPIGTAGNIPSLKQVLYGNDCIPFLQDCIESLADMLINDGRPGSGSEGTHIEYFFRNWISPYLILAKNPSFTSEREWRIYSRFGGPVKFRESKYGPVPYIDVYFDPKSVAEVMVSPSHNSVRRAKGASAILQNLGYHSVGTAHSVAPYIG